MAKGFCAKCHNAVGGFLKPSGYKCTGCGKIICSNCALKRGVVTKTLYCPECGNVLKP